MVNSKRSQVATDIAIAVATAVPLMIAGQPGAAMAALSASAPSLMAAVSKFMAEPDKRDAEVAWDILSEAYALSLVYFFSKVGLERRPEGAELRDLIARLVTRAEILVEQSSQNVTAEMLYSPLKVPFLRDAAKNLPYEVKLFHLLGSATDCRNLFENCVAEALIKIKDSSPERWTRFEQSLSGAFLEAIEKRKSLARHHDSIIRTFTQRAVFGQEDTGITLSDLYVRQRAIWNTKVAMALQLGEEEHEHPADRRNFFQDERQPRKWCYPLFVNDLHEVGLSWLDAKDPQDAIRVVAGGPGSGKSTLRVLLRSKS
ncbi:hypothetical protein [Rhizobium leguminosarum]|uniref:Uncharacterized protein n=1 Tax=Rhizobium leguminosarum TaxID=384 RepID=A0A1B1C839_RHILE|nr:hypothetical protein [Rhizobium leguminosarum]ANP85846.1 hypothetical protein BA011_08960 [Rhizobium leguminosarum]